MAWLNLLKSTASEAVTSAQQPSVAIFAAFLAIIRRAEPFIALL